MSSRRSARPAAGWQRHPRGVGGFTTNPAGSAIVNALGPIRQIVQGENDVQRRYLVIVPGTAAQLGAPVQIQVK